MTDTDKEEIRKTFSDIVGDFLEEKRGEVEDTFAELLDSYDSGSGKELRIGDKISGTVIAIGKDSVFVNTGTKIDGTIDRLELLDENKEITCQPGDVLELYVMKLSEHEIILSKALSGVGGLNMIRDAQQSGAPIEGKVKEQIKGGFHVELFHHRAFCPVSQMDTKFVEKPDEYVGKTFPFLITRVEERGKNIVVSRRELLERNLEAQRQKYMEEVEVGKIFEGTVKRIMPFGVFVEILPGIEGMLHVSELSWSRFDKPNEVVSEGDRIPVKVIQVDAAGEKAKISLSAKAITGDPWLHEIQNIQVGEKRRGKVIQTAPFGAFVEIAPGIEGLVHISEMSYVKRIVKPEDVVRIGEIIDVTIKEVDIDRKRISLSIRDAEGDPWIGVEDRYRRGQVVQGIVEKKEKFGFFVSIEPGVTGLLPKSKISRSQKPSEIEKLKEGDPIPLIIDSIDTANRKITLGPGDPKEAESTEDWKKYSDNTAAASSRASAASSTASTSSSSSMGGILGEKLKAALNSKK